jgi:hypothetical protein
VSSSRPSNGTLICRDTAAPLIYGGCSCTVRHGRCLNRGLRCRDMSVVGTDDLFRCSRFRRRRDRLSILSGTALPPLLLLVQLDGDPRIAGVADRRYVEMRHRSAEVTRAIATRDPPFTAESGLAADQ